MLFLWLLPVLDVLSMRADERLAIWGNIYVSSSKAVQGMPTAVFPDWLRPELFHCDSGSQHWCSQPQHLAGKEAPAPVSAPPSLSRSLPR